MARIRSIKPEFFYSEQVASVSAFARVFFIGLWTVADRDGRLQWAARKLKAQIFPYDQDVQIHALAEELTAAGLLHIYEADHAAYAWIPGFVVHQRPHPKEPASIIPPCPEGHHALDLPWNREKPLKNTADTGTIPPSPGGREGKGREGKELPDPPTTHPASRPKPLTRSMQPWNVWEGQRLEVPRGWHDEHVRKLGGVEPEARLLTWYDTLDARLVRSGVTVKNWFRYLSARYDEWAPDPTPTHAPVDNSQFAAIEARLAELGGAAK
jgi:hypothetical protein